MNKNLAAAISAAAIVAAIGICGGIECGTIAFEVAILPLLALAAVSLLMGSVAAREAAFEREVAARSEARRAREAARRAASPAPRPAAAPVRLARR